MSLITGTITTGSNAGETFQFDLPTVRVPELPVASNVQGIDLLTLWQSATNKQTQWNIDALISRIVTGDNPVTSTPTVYGADVEIIIANSEDLNANGAGGNSRVSRAALANQKFALERRGEGQLLTTEYTILSSGGFDLNAVNGRPQKVRAGEVFIAHVFSYVAQGTGNNNTTSVSRFSGAAKITTNTTLGAAQRYMFLEAEFGSAHGVITLEDIATAPANMEVVIQAVLNDYNVTISAKSGQKIYYQNTSNDYLYLAKGEVVGFVRQDDGWYITTPLDFLEKVGKIDLGYIQGINQLLCQGQLLNRADYPRLWQKIQSSGFSLVSDATWNSVVTISDTVTGVRTSYKPYEGCFSTGNNSTTFRLPDLQEKFLRGLNNIGSSDTERPYNYAGSVQPDSNRKHGHDIDWELNGTDGLSNGYHLPGSTTGETNTDGTFTGTASPIHTAGGYESRGINAGLLPLINI